MHVIIYIHTHMLRIHVTNLHNSIFTYVILYPYKFIIIVLLGK